MHRDNTKVTIRKYVQSTYIIIVIKVRIIISLETCRNVPALGQLWADAGTSVKNRLSSGMFTGFITTV